MSKNKCDICREVAPFHPDKKCCFNCARNSSECEAWHNCGDDCHEWECRSIDTKARMTWKFGLDGYTDIGLAAGYSTCDAIIRLAAYEDAMPLERAQELAHAEKDGRLVVMPCKNGTVYTIEEDYFNCGECKHGNMARYQVQIDRVSCDMDNGFHCPFYIKGHEVSGFEITFDETGGIVLSLPGEFGYEGLEQFSGIDGKVYYTREEAEAALKKRSVADNEYESI